MKRWLATLCVVLPFGATRAAEVQGMTKDPFSAVPAAAFQNAIGICTHLGYDAAHGWGDDAYGDFEGKVLPALRYLGTGKLKTLRDSFAYTYYFDKFQQIHDAFGIQFTLYAGTGPAVNYSDGMAWVKAHPSIVKAAEGTNESDNWPSIFGGQTGPSATVAEQTAIATDLAGTSTLVYGPSIGNPANLPAIAAAGSDASITNVHAYPSGGTQPDAWLGDWIAKSSVNASPGMPVAITEGGYSTEPMAGNNGSVPLDVQAKETLNFLFSAFFDHAVMEIDLYELLDEHPDPSGSDRENHFGLFHFDGTPKPAATALRNLLAVIDDTMDQQSGRLAYTTQGLDGHAVLMRKSNGAFLIAVWAEPKIWDGNTESPAPVQSVTVAFGEPANSVQVFDPLVGPDAISTDANVSQVTVEVTDHPVIIELNGPVGLNVSDLDIPVAQLLPASVNPPQRSATGSNWDQRARNALAQQTQEGSHGDPTTQQGAGSAATAGTGNSGGNGNQLVASHGASASDGGSGVSGGATAEAVVGPAGNARGSAWSNPTTDPSSAPSSPADAGSVAAAQNQGASPDSGRDTTPAGISAWPDASGETSSGTTSVAANGPAVGAQTFAMNGLTGLATNFANWGGITTLANNGEEQNYVPGAVAAGPNGSVTLTGRPATAQDQSNLPYVSGMVETSPTFSQQYGYFQLAAQLPAGKGTWPAFWLFGKDSSATYREVDVFEFTGDPHVLNFSTHVGSQGNGTTIPITLPFDASQGVHTYGVNWTPTTFTLYVDGKPLATQDATGFANQGPMYMIANVALGGNWPGNPDATTPFPATMKIQSMGAWAAP